MATGVYTANPSGASTQLRQSEPCPLTSLPAPPCFSPKTHSKIIQQSGPDSCPAHESAKQAHALSPPNAWHIKRRGLLFASAAEVRQSLSCWGPEYGGGWGMGVRGGMGHRGWGPATIQHLGLSLAVPWARADMGGVHSPGLPCKHPPLRGLLRAPARPEQGPAMDRAPARSVSCCSWLLTWLGW